MLLVNFQAFVHDPLINWRLFNMNEVPQMGTLASNRTLTSDGGSALQDPASPIQRGCIIGLKYKAMNDTLEHIRSIEFVKHGENRTN